MKERLLELITEVVGEMNDTREEKIGTENLSEVGLYGDAGVFDSMHLVSFLAMVEEKLEDEYDVEISLTSEKAVSMRVSPFSSVRRLIAFIEGEIGIARGEVSKEDAAGELALQGG